MFDEYCRSLDAGMRAKRRLIAPCIPRAARGEVIDVGSGTGTLLAMLAGVHPHLRMVGIDRDPRMAAAARWRHERAGRNLSIRRDHASRVHSSNAVAVILSSLLHELYSEQGDSPAAVTEALRCARAALVPGGRVIVREFVAPADPGRRVLLRHRNSDIVDSHDFASFVCMFGRPACLNDVTPGQEWTTYSTDAGTALEFLLRKDYHSLWRAQLRERYAFWTVADALQLVVAAGLRPLFYRLFSSEWLVRKRWLGKAELLDPETLERLPYPAQQILLVAECAQTVTAPAMTGSKPAGHLVLESYFAPRRSAPFNFAPVRSAPVKSAP
jgi:SAM-dependent methyltransferase